MSLIGMGGYFIHTISVDGINLWTSCELTPCITYLSLSFAINLVFTVGIIWRLVYVRREISGGSLGREVARVYTSILAMLIESASLYTIVALLAIIACARRIPMQDALLPMLGQLQAIPPLMITLRVMEGRAVTWETWHNPAPSRKSPSLNFTSVIPPTFLGSTAKVDIEFDSSYSSNRFSRIYISSSGEAKESSIMDWDVPPCAGPVSERPTKLWICTDLHGFASGSITAVDEENGCGLSGDPNPFPPSPQSPPIAFTPRNSTATDLSRTIWTHV
ncbi:hypothetical protein TRAPUB_7756 [Trametes pubescens]|uniref:Uncharacterized protein n=1 Tax=Trametes pubescens TaxID=154538 RepID=A0A1M2V295_TRAPU|nr:hypothetical protein TRAPUB_7756 [Trametes pubescens]